MLNHPNRIFGLDVIRATAILLVLLSHCTYILPEFNKSLTDGIRLLGATGVDIFFVLSGYLIGGILLRKLDVGKIALSDLMHFWKRRWLRTLPNYFLVLILNIFLVFFLDDDLVNDVWLYFLFLQNFLTLHPNFFTEAWSLSIEEYAYLILPFLMYVSFVIFKNLKASKVFLYTTVFIIFFLFILKIHFYYSVEIESYKDWSSLFRKVVIYRLDAIYYGFVLVYLVSKYDFFKKQSYPLFIFGLILFICLHVIIVLLQIIPNSHKLFYSIFYLPLISISIAMVFPYFLKLKASNNIMKFIKYISTRSYALYLVNYSLVMLTFQQFLRPSILTVVIYLIVTFIISEILYRWFEIPILKLRKRLVPR
ncbi:hypothetical protein BTO05_13685 [Winogradskyella sp. PC-19]|uniref:acyltransferase family protein n=1 Tax=unclassified Winogradskyella TaxID=2615021 RepID=UPI000B3C9C9E|nr:MULTISPECIES: acyltransferase [unclassified Winogradskyella]ARV10634.1 hypothetical protein BTO05_13685 [Winogradskyella sp. PC-19]